jgi:hypothetical protein
MAIQEQVSGVGANSSRTDNNVSERVAKIQREAKIQNSTGGAYTNRQDLTSLAGGASTDVPTPNMNMSQPSQVSSIPSVNAFAPGSGRNGVPLSDGAKYGDGRDDRAQPPTVDAPNIDSIFIRAMAQANPESRQLFMMVEALNEMELMD